MVCMAVSLWSYSNDDAPVVGGPENSAGDCRGATADVSALSNATDVNWSVKGEYNCGGFMAATPCGGKQICSPGSTMPAGGTY